MAVFLLVLLVCLSLAFITSHLLQWIKVPRVVAEILAGMILGIPVLKALLFDQESLTVLKVFADIGIILSFFFLGLEIDIRKFKTHIEESALIAVFNTLLPFMGGLFVSHFFFSFSWLVSAVIGIALAVSAQTISLDFLEEFKLLKTKIGQAVISAGAVADVLQLIFISVIVALIAATTAKTALLTLLFNITYFIILLILIKYTIIPLILKYTNEKSKPLLFMSAIIIVLLTAGIAEYLQLGAIIGALFGGILLRQTLLISDKKPWEEHQIAQAFHTVSFGFLVPIFFIWAGLNTSLSLIVANASLVLIFILIAMGGTVLGTILGAKLSHASLREGNLIGWGVSAKGDTDLVLATIALQAGVLSQNIFSALVMTALVTTLVGPTIFRILLKKAYKRN